MVLNLEFLHIKSYEASVCHKWVTYIPREFQKQEYEV